MPVYNCEQYVTEAIESILNQTLTDFELIIVDDHSTDNTREIVRSFTDPRVNLLVKPENTGISSCLNIGLELARGEYIARMDGDDISYLNRLVIQVDYLQQNPNIVLCGAWFECIPTKEVIKHPTHHEDIKIALLNYCALGHSTVMFRKQIFITHKLQYNSEFEPAEDYNLWTKVISFGEIANIPEVLLQYRIHNSQVSQKRSLLQKHKANLCIQTMLYKPLEEITKEDIAISDLALQTKILPTTNTLYQVINWFEQLIAANKKNTFYKKSEFNVFISLKKTNLIRLFFLFRYSYNPKILFCFLLLSPKNRQSLFFAEQIKLFIKCIIFWRSKNTCPH